MVSAKLGVPVEHHEARPGEVQGFGLESSKARALSFSPKVGFDDGLSRYIEWRRDQKGP